MMPALHKIIHENQTGFMPDRRISVNIRKLLDIMDYLDRNGQEGIVISCDYQKCFDKISFSALTNSLKYFQFANFLIEWTNILYTDFEVKIQNTGKFSKEITIGQGVHQGGPASSCYFLVIAEIIALNMRNNNEIEGIPVEEIINVLSQFADDMDIFSKFEQASYNACLKEIDNFYYHSGFKLSYDKTTVYRIGSLKKSSAKLYTQGQDLTWSNETIKVLGIDVYHDNKELVNKNYIPLINKSEGILKQWANRNLSLFGKINVINTLVTSLFIYKMFVLPSLTSDIIRRIEQVFHDYLWNGRRAKIALKILTAPKKWGGAGMCNIRIRDQSMKATWVQILDNFPNYANMVYRMLKIPVGKLIWSCTIAANDTDIIVNRVHYPFWYDTLHAWAKYNTAKGQRIENQILWFNSQIRIDDKPFFLKKCWDNGLIYLHQLFENMEVISAIKAARKFGITFMELNQIISAVPYEWRKFFKNTEPTQYQPIPPTNGQEAVNIKGLASKVYYVLSENSAILLKKTNSWTEDLGVDIDCNALVKMINRTYVITNVPKLRSFHYRILQRAIVTNKHLCVWKIRDDSLCTFCKNSTETIKHLFFECPEVASIWDGVIDLLNEQYCIQVDGLTYQKIITSNSGISTFVDFILLLTKQWIYRIKCSNQSLSSQSLKLYINQIENIEKYIAIKNKKLNKHLTKWGRA